MFSQEEGSSVTWNLHLRRELKDEKFEPIKPTFLGLFGGGVEDRLGCRKPDKNLYVLCFMLN